MTKVLFKLLGLSSADSKLNSRRFITLIFLTLLFTLIYVAPPLVTMLLSCDSLILLSEMGYIGLITFLWGSYLASDWGTKKLGQYMNSDTNTNVTDINTTTTTNVNTTHSSTEGTSND